MANITRLGKLGGELHHRLCLTQTTVLSTSEVRLANCTHVKLAAPRLFFIPGQQHMRSHGAHMTREECGYGAVEADRSAVLALALGRGAVRSLRGAGSTPLPLPLPLPPIFRSTVLVAVA